MEILTITAKVRKDRNAEIQAAVVLANQGVENPCRALSKQRHVAECMAEGAVRGDSPFQRRSRKFSTPLFMTPTGYLTAFPELDEHLFLSFEKALQAIEKYGKPDHQTLWNVRSTTLESERRDKRFQRWIRDVKPLGIDYDEPRRSLEERASIYAENGIEGLRKLYTKSHASSTERRLLETGLAATRAPRSTS